ncbi:MAG: hypothetical protein IKJ68_07010 [Clostridia bacterium]|nr:hypothetical protein [Clostridia bacterium]
MQKIYSLILALALIFSVVPNVTATEVANSDDYSFAFAQGVANAVGVSFADGEAVTRADFVSAVVKASGMSGVSGSKNPFADVTDATKGYEDIKTAYELSWISSASLFNPDSPITLVQALKIGIHAIGGEQQAAYLGGYPTGYLRVAQTTELLENIDNADDAPLSYRDAYVLIYNILNAKTFEVGFTGNNEVTVSHSGDSILHTKYNMYIHTGVVTANAVTNLYNEAESGRTTVVIGNTEFCDGTGSTDYLGYNVYALCEKTGAKDYVRFMSPFDTNAITISGDEIDHIDGNTIYYGESGNDKIKVSASFVYLQNGKTTPVTNPDISSLFASGTSSYTFIDNDDDKNYDIISANIYTYTVVDRYDLFDGAIYDINSSDSFIDLSADDCVVKARSYKNGQYSLAKLSDIENGMVIAAAVSSDKKYVDIILCFDSENGKVDEMSSDGKVVINGKEYTFSSYYSSYYTFDLGEEARYLLGINGEIVAEAGAKSSMKYGFFIDRFRGQGLDKSIIFKIFDQSGKMIELECADKVTIDGNSKTAADAYSFVGTLSSDAEKFIRYSVNGDGKINCIDSHETKFDDVESYGSDRPENNSLTLYFDNKFQPRGSKLFLDPDGMAKFNWQNTDYIFVLPPDGERDDEELYRIADASEIKTAGTEFKLDILAFDIDASGSAKAIVVYGGHLQSAANVDMISTYGVVEKVSRALYHDGEECYKLDICDASGFKTVYLPMETADKYGLPAIGDVIGCAVKDDTISYHIICFDFSTYTIDSNYSDEDNDNAFMFGFIYSLSGGYMHYLPPHMKTEYIPECPQNLDFTKMRNANISQTKTVYVDAVRSVNGEQVKHITVNANPDAKIKTIKTSGKEPANFVVNRLVYGNSQVSFVYTISYK